MFGNGNASAAHSLSSTGLTGRPSTPRRRCAGAAEALAKAASRAKTPTGTLKCKARTDCVARLQRRICWLRDKAQLHAPYRPGREPGRRECTAQGRRCAACTGAAGQAFAGASILGHDAVNFLR